MKKVNRYIIMCIVLMASTFCYGQEIFVKNHTSAEFPNSSFELFLLDENGNYINNATLGSISIDDANSGSCSISSFTNNSAPNTEFDLTIAFDMAIGTSVSDTLFSYAKEVLNEICNTMQAENIKMAVTSFDHLSYLHQPYTMDYDSLHNARSFFKQAPVSFLSSVFDDSPTAAINVAKSDKHSALLLVTDSYDEIEESSIIEKAKADNISIFVLQIGNTISSSLKEVALQSGGAYFDEFDFISLPAKTASSLASALLFSYKPYLVEYKDNNTCNRKHDITIKYSGISDKEVKFEYTDKHVNRPTLEATTPDNKPYYGFSIVKPETESSIGITITAVNSDINIDSVYIMRGEEVNLPPFNDILKITKDTHPKILKEGKSFDVTLKFHPVDSAMIFTKLVIVSDACIGDEIFITAGYPSVAPKDKPTLKGISPKENDIFQVGDSVKIEWQGLLPEDMVHITFLSDEEGEIVRLDSLAKVYGEYDTESPSVFHHWPLGPDHLIDSARFELIQWWPNKIGEANILRHDDEVNSAFFSNDPSNSRIITASGDSTVSIWDSQSGQHLTSIKTNGGVVFAEYTHDNTGFLTASDDRLVTVWNATTYDSLMTFKMPGITTVALFSLNDDYVIAADLKGNIKIWDITQPDAEPIYSKVFNYQGTYPIRSVDIHPTIDGLIMFACYNGNVYFDNFLVDDDDFLNILSIHQGLGKEGVRDINLQHCAFNETGDMFAVASDPTKIDGKIIDKNVSVWSFDTSDYTFSLYHTIDSDVCGLANSLTFKNYAPLGNMLVVSNTSNNIYVWDVDTKMQHDYFIGVDTEHEEAVKTCAFNFDCNIMLTSSVDHTARLWYRDHISVQIDTTDYFSLELPNIEGHGIDFDYCAINYNSDTLSLVALRNTSNIPVIIEAIELTGSDKDHFLIVDDIISELPLKLQPGEVRNIAIRFSPKSSGDFACNLDVSYKNNIPQAFFDRGDVLEKFTFPITGSGYIRELTTVSDLLNFESIEIYESGLIEKQVFIENKSPLDITISNVGIDGFAAQEFSIQDLGFNEMGYVLTAGSSLPVVISFTPNEYGEKSAQLIYESDAMFNPIPVNLFGHSIPIITDSLLIRIDNITGEPGDIVSLPIKLVASDLANSYEKIDGFSGYIKFNKNVLVPVGNFEIDSTAGDYRFIKVDLPKDADANNILKTIEFEVGLGNIEVSPITLEDFTSIGLAKVRIVEENAEFTLTGFCKEGSIPRLFEQDGSIALGQNMPNPFTEETTFSFDVLESGTTKLYITNIEGKTLKTICNKNLEPGHHEIPFVNTDLPLGKYFYTLETPTQKHTKSFIIE
ncbi:MAG: hypothetical protein B7C24_07480 [Bacteroidetes bacterium 4572_77]|nr:MAG: hypothetical protein B7C24_07480 [Bacteroidetes bacterium 4572_77]